VQKRDLARQTRDRCPALRYSKYQVWAAPCDVDSP